MYRAILSSALLLAFVQIASACPGQTGKIIFSDDFSDDSGGWDLDANVTVQQGAMQIKTDPKVTTDGTLNSSFNAFEADYCAEFSFPPEPAESNNNDDVGIYLLGTDYKNKFALTIDSAGQAWINRTVNGDNAFLMPVTKEPSIKISPGAVNALRVVFKDQKLTFFINGEQIKVVRASVPDTANRFGLWAGLDKKAPQTVRIFSVKSYQVNQIP